MKVTEYIFIFSDGRGYSYGYLILKVYWKTDQLACPWWCHCGRKVQLKYASHVSFWTNVMFAERSSFEHIIACWEHIDQSLHVKWYTHFQSLFYIFELVIYFPRQVKPIKTEPDHKHPSSIIPSVFFSVLYTTRLVKRK